MNMHTIRAIGGPLLAALIAVSAIAVPNAAQATLVDHGGFTSDTATGLDWLDLTDPRALGQSYNTVTGLFGSTLAGWRYATLAEIATVYDNAGGISPYDFLNPQNGGAAQQPAAALLLSLLGDTGAFGLPAGWGITADPDTNGGIGSPSTHFLAIYTNLPPTTNFLIVPFNSLADTDSSEIIGSFLVRTSAVPEPASLLLFGAGLLPFVFVRRKLPA